MKAFVATVGIPKEIKESEGRVAITPDGVRELERLGVEVLIETSAGEGASIADADYIAAGATIVPAASDAWACDMVVKVKEPQASEFLYLRPNLTLFTYLHLAAYPEVAKALLSSSTTSFAYETVQLSDGTLPLLAPMSEVAGRLSAQIGAFQLMKTQGGSGILMGGVPGTPKAKVVIIGGGVAGTEAAVVAQGVFEHALALLIGF
jgi:alanine dehydrogenase